MSRGATPAARGLPATLCRRGVQRPGRDNAGHGPQEA